MDSSGQPLVGPGALSSSSHDNAAAASLPRTPLDVELATLDKTRSPGTPVVADAGAAAFNEDKDILRFLGYTAPTWKACCFYLVALLTAGLSLLLCHWSPRVYIFLRLVPCSLGSAQYVVVKLVDGRVHINRLQRLVTGAAAAGDAGSLSPQPSCKDVEDGRENLLDWQASTRHLLLEYRCMRYLYDDALGTFRAVPEVPPAFNAQLQRLATRLAAGGQLGEPEWELGERAVQYGSNEMNIPVKSIPALIFDEMWHPFYVFQYASIVIWCAGDQYYSYSVCIAVITWFSIISSAVEAHRNMRRLAGIAHFAAPARVLRDGAFVELPSPRLVPGDLILVRPGTLPCDAVLLAGECIVDENMLTGESVPVRKVPYCPAADGLGYAPDRSPGCTLFGGTAVAQARGAGRGHKGGVLALVVRTRFCSAKGQLLRSILFPRSHGATFVGDSLKFIAVMLVGCMALYVWAAVVLASVGADGVRIMVRFFDMITIAVPPALPACLTIATVFSIRRFRKNDIFVTSPDRIAMAGQLDVICFDKTGTLTEQGLELQGIVPVSHGGFQPMTASAAELPQLLLQLLASCHGLALMGGELVGDPLDQKLFQATAWQLLDEGEDGEGEEDGGLGAAVPAPAPEGLAPLAAPPLGSAAAAADAGQHQRPARHEVRTLVRPPGATTAAESYSIVRRFEFSSTLQRNVVLVSAAPATSHPDPPPLSVFAKGSPEAIRALVDPASVPADFDAALAGYTREGLRVLALAAGGVAAPAAAAAARWSQEELEQRVPLALVGLAVMVNPLRPDSADTVAKLQAAGVRTCMVTGDHLRTAISVSHLCGIMPLGRSVFLVDAPAPGAAPPVGSEAGAGEGMALSVLHPGGAVDEVRTGSEAASAAAAVNAGELACAVTGKGFTQLLESRDPLLLAACLTHSSVFARMSPDNKRDLMGLLGDGLDWVDACPHLGLHVGFCGDGANDCGALKASHVGVSLCEAEASVAAPLTSRRQTTAAMLAVVAEGRCSLMATFQIFQFIIGYALVQAFETNLMYTYALNVGNYQYLIQDLFFTTVLAALMGYTRPRPQLAPVKPPTRVMTLPLMVSTVLQLLVVIVFQLLSLALLANQPDYEQTQGPPDLRLAQAPENTVTYLVALGQFIILALVFNKGRPHRSSLYTNVGLLLALVLQTVFLLYSLFSDDRFNTEVQELVGKGTVVTNRMRVLLLILIALNAVAAFGMAALSSGVVALIRWIYPPAVKKGLQYTASKHAAAGTTVEEQRH